MKHPIKILSLVLILLNGCQKEKGDESLFNFERIEGTYDCFAEHYFVQLIRDLPENNIYIENLQCPLLQNPLASDCGTLKASVSKGNNNYIIDFTSFKVKSEFYPDTLYMVDLPPVEVEILRYGEDEIRHEHAYFMVVGNDFFDSGYIDQNPHYRLKSFEYDNQKNHMFLNIWLEKTIGDTLFTWSIWGQHK